MQDKPKTSLLSNLLNLIRLPFFSGSLNKYRLLLSLISALMLLAVLVLGLSMWTTNQMLAHTKILIYTLKKPTIWGNLWVLIRLRCLICQPTALHV